MNTHKNENPILVIRLGWDNAHYSKGLVSGGYLLEIFGDALTILMQKHDGDGGLLGRL